MQRPYVLTLLLALAIPAHREALAVVVASSVGPTIADDLNVTSFAFILPPELAEVPGQRRVGFTAANEDDVFGYERRDSTQNDFRPANLLDNSIVSGSDSLGIIKSQDFDDFFGVVDTLNSDNEENTPLIAEWVFDTSGASGELSISIDMAAMGDFEAGNPDSPSADFFRFEVAKDGGDFNTVWESSVESDATDVPYQLENGEGPPVLFDDPLVIDGARLTNDFQGFFAQLGSAGDSLALRFTGHADGGTEVFAFRNIVIESMTLGMLPLGDYSSDGVVDAVDYAAWREALDGGGVLPNDATPGVDATDLTQWADNYGGLATPSGVAAPEPAAWLMLLGGAPVWLAARRRGTRS